MYFFFLLPYEIELFPNYTLIIFELRIFNLIRTEPNYLFVTMSHILHFLIKLKKYRASIWLYFEIDILKESYIYILKSRTFHGEIFFFEKSHGERYFFVSFVAMFYLKNCPIAYHLNPTLQDLKE